MGSYLHLVVDDKTGPRLVDDQPKNPPAPPEPEKKGPRPDETRRRDAVVDAARTLTDLGDDSEELAAFVKRRWSGTRVLESQDIIDFAKDARRQRVEDVVDALDHRVRQKVFGRSQAVHVTLPRGLAKKEIQVMEDDELTAVVQRLKDRGWTADQIRKNIARGLDDERRRIVTALMPSTG